MSYVRSVSRISNELIMFRFYLMWMCMDQSNARHTMIFLPIFLLLGVFIQIASHFVIFCGSTHHAYVVVQLSLTSVFGLSYFVSLSLFRCCNLHYSIFLDNIDFFN
ncbi:hypothetical protein B296_00028644 [Ensete ventricosum]|uniref:Uncharacterized protein n=1 Tax=Ensete ventricosum TaxID=4639 RepID=A0A426YY58_ENSVE|nr:hypothetical protein B296_00028644 [Ensete ventricosum]